MIGELVIATYIVECARGSYYCLKEAQRKRRALDSFGDILKHSATLEELSRNLNADKLNNPVLYKKVPQTWMFRLYNKLAKE